MPRLVCHAALQREGERAVGAAVGAAGDDRGADQRAGEGDMELPGHVGARRQARDRGAGGVGVEGGQGLGGLRRQSRRKSEKGRADPECSA